MRMITITVRDLIAIIVRLSEFVSTMEGLFAPHHRASVVCATLGSGKLSMNHLKNGYNVFTCWPAR